MAVITKQIVVTFTQLSQPVDTLSPSITIIDITDAPTTITTIVNSDTMFSLGQGGGYAYNFTTFDPDRNYYVIIDGGVAQLDQERYAFTSNTGEFREIVNGVWDEAITDHLTNGSTGQALYNASNNDNFFGFGL
jgi:hypothetical protein